MHYRCTFTFVHKCINSDQFAQRFSELNLQSLLVGDAGARVAAPGVRLRDFCGRHPLKWAGVNAP
eukprot:SAG22_NODE_13229_length_413_cov_1.914013_1_plen_64_part_10